MATPDTPGDSTSAGDAVAQLHALLTSVNDAIAALAARQDLTEVEQEEVRSLAEATASTLFEPPDDVVKRVVRNEGRLEVHSQLVTRPTPTPTPRTGVAGVVDVASERVTDAVENLSSRAFARLVVLGVLALFVMLALAVVFVARNSGYTVTTSGSVTVEDAERVEGSPVNVDAEGAEPFPDL